MNLSFVRGSYYKVKPFIPRSVQLRVRSVLVRKLRNSIGDQWPICTSVSVKKPDYWVGWPSGRAFALILTHDVDTAQGQEKCLALSKIEREIGFWSSFNFVPERYSDKPWLRQELSSQDFEIGVHGLNHDGNLFSSKKEFVIRAGSINKYLDAWDSAGFRSPAMHHNLEWIKLLNIEYDASTFDTDPFEPQPDGAGTIFPFWVPRDDGTGYVELPYTLPQDFTLFILMKEKNIDIWKKKLDWIAENGGMALINTHPDYMHFGEGRPGPEEYPVKFYKEFLGYVKDNYKNRYWHCLPREIAGFWREEVVGAKNTKGVKLRKTEERNKRGADEIN